MKNILYATRTLTLAISCFMLFGETKGMVLSPEILLFPIDTVIYDTMKLTRIDFDKKVMFEEEGIIYTVPYKDYKIQLKSIKDNCKENMKRLVKTESHEFWVSCYKATDSLIKVLKHKKYKNAIYSLSPNYGVGFGYIVRIGDLLERRKCYLNYKNGDMVEYVIRKIAIHSGSSSHSFFYYYLPNKEKYFASRPGYFS